MSLNPEIARLFEHSICRAAAALVRRCNQNIVTNRRGSDVTLDAGKLCNACHHLPEAIAPFDADLANRFEQIDEFNFLRDISDTSKHHLLRKPERQVEMVAIMTYACLVQPGTREPVAFGFGGTEIIASSQMMEPTNVLDDVYSFARKCAAEMSLPEPLRPAGPGSIFVGEVIMRTGEETISFEDIELRFFMLDEGKSTDRETDFEPGEYTVQIVDMAGVPMDTIAVHHKGQIVGGSRETGRSPSGSERRVTSAPPDEQRKLCKIYAYVSDEALSGREVVNIRCNCGSLAEYRTRSSSNVCECANCGTTIGIFGVTGGPGRISFKLLDGTTGTVPIHGFDKVD